MSKAFTKEDDGMQDLDLDGEEELEEEKPRGARYITRAGFQKLQAELEHLWKVERPKVTAEVSAAAALGDRSENAEYIYGKKKLREIDRRMRFLSKRLDSLTVVEPTKEQQGKVFFGAWVTIEDEDGVEATYQIVGADEFDIKARKISVESPMAKALIGKKVGDAAVVQRPKGETEVTIVKIRYES
ncbi:MAG: transcription elongation factor GreB [Myxococcales bacterium]